MIYTPHPHRQQVQSYINTCGIVDVTARQQLHDFSDGIYDLGLWNSMVCWPMRSSQNVGTGTVVQSLGGLGSYNGSTIGSPVWATSGIVLSNPGTGTNNQYINIPMSLFTSGINNFIMGVYSRSDLTNYGRIFEMGDGSGDSALRLETYPTGNVVAAGWPDKLGTYIHPTVTYTDTVGPYHSIYGYKQGNVFTCSLDAGMVYSSSITQATYALPSTAISSAIGMYLPATVPFAGIIRTDVSYSTVVNINNLYKSTLGLGLGLP